jgi:ribosome-binding protein aMBF1 (putative translation factor)
MFSESVPQAVATGSTLRSLRLGTDIAIGEVVASLRRHQSNLPLGSGPKRQPDPRSAAVSTVEAKFGERVRELRRARGWTQEDLSAASGLAVVQVSRIERGKREVRLGTIVRLLRALEAPAGALLDDLADDST